jgi:hypothetical protein
MKVTVNGDKNIQGRWYEDGDEYTGRTDTNMLRKLYQRGFINVEGEGSLAVTGRATLRSVGGGWYELPDGSRVQGRTAAERAIATYRSDSEWSAGKAGKDE